mgnify:FL=1
MKEEKFKVINFIRELILLIDSKMENFPKKEIELKNRINMNSYDILEICYLAIDLLNCFLA